MVELFSSQQFFYGVLLGGVLFGALGLLALQAYKHTLVLCANAQSAEKLQDGKFYYLVQESEYNRLKLREQQHMTLSQAARRVFREALLDRSGAPSVEGLTELRMLLQLHGVVQWDASVLDPELDVTGTPKLPLSVLERQAVETLNLIKAWADDPHRAEFPVEALMGADLVLGFAQMRRKGVQ